MRADIRSDDEMQPDLSVHSNATTKPPQSATGSRPGGGAPRHLSREDQRPPNGTGVRSLAGQRSQTRAGTVCWSIADEDLEGLAVGHSAVAVGHLVQADGAVEDAAGLDGAVEDVGHEFLDVGASGGGAAGEGDIAKEHCGADGAFPVLGDAEPADDTAIDDGAERGFQGLLGADALDHLVGAVAAGQLPDLLGAFVAALGDDVGGAEVAAEVGAVGVPAYQNDLFGTEPVRGQDRGQADRAVADDGDGVTPGDAGLHGAVVAGAQDVGEGQQRGQQRGVRCERQLDQGALRLRDADGFALAAVDAVEAVAAAVPAGGLQALAAEVARVVAPGGLGDHQIASLQPGYLRPGLLYDADALVAHRATLVSGGARRVGAHG